MISLPLRLPHVKAPPVKCQGIKTKLVPFIFANLEWTPGKEGRWMEPFFGSGVVALNLAPERALLADSNRHIITLYKAIQNGSIQQAEVRRFLDEEGKKLKSRGAEYYYEVRERFNQTSSSLDFLFLNRSCFNGVMRFNRNGKFNVPFGHKPQRFSAAYITKIVNQIGWVAKQMRDKDWEFRVADWRQTLAEVEDNDFVYLDPPYLGRHTDYYNSWSEAEASELALYTQKLSGGFAVSMWMANQYRHNPHIAEHWTDLEMRVCSHFYHVGASENLRHEMREALLIKKGFAATICEEDAQMVSSNVQLSLAPEWSL